MRHLILTSLLLFCQLCYAQIKNPFPFIRYDSVVMYDYEQGREEGEIVYNGMLDGRIKKLVVLDKATVNSINTIIGKGSSYNNIVAGCFDPHLGVVYYKTGKIVGYMSICLQCSNLYSTPDIKNRKPAISTGLRNYFNRLVLKYHFSHSIGIN